MGRGSRIGLIAIVLTGVPGRSARPGDLPLPAYPHKTFVAQEFGEGARSYWLFEPAEPTPERAPVVVFHHGWLATNPGIYGAWVEHLTRSGRIVIFPRYQTDWSTRPADFLPNALTAVRDAFDVLRAACGHVRPDLEQFAIIGHSAGGNLSAMMAAVAKDQGLPPAKAVISLLPGEVRPIRQPSLAEIPPQTLLVVVAVEQDWVVGDGRARQIFAEATAVPSARKKYVFYRTDREGPIPLVADHLAPTGALARLDTGEGPMHGFQISHADVDILDRYGFWRLADLTLNAAFAGLTLDEATANGDLFRDLGRWSDGHQVLPPIVGDDLAAIPHVFPAHGARLIPLSSDDYMRRLSSREK
jgi:acetyl esterase/lipase